VIGQSIAAYLVLGLTNLTSATAYNWAEALGPAMFGWLENRGYFGERP